MNRCIVKFHCVEPIGDGAHVVYDEIHYNPTTSEIASTRKSGAIILKQVIEVLGSVVTKSWITDDGIPIISSVG